MQPTISVLDVVGNLHRGGAAEECRNGHADEHRSSRCLRQRRAGLPIAACGVVVRLVRAPVEDLVTTRAARELVAFVDIDVGLADRAVERAALARDLIGSCRHDR